MLNLKKTAVAVLALGSSAVFAGTMGPVCAPLAVTVPCESTAWDFGVKALYLQSRGHDFNNGFSLTTTGSDEFFDSGDRNNDWDWGFMLEASYHFSNGNDININWYHMDQTNDFNFDGFSFFPPLDFIGVGVVGNYKYSLHPNWDAVNFEFGQMANFGEHKVIRFHGGAQYAHIERQHRWDALSLATVEVPVITTIGRIYDRDEEFNGFGPRVGMDMSYHFGNGFAIYANGATALLVGQNKHTTHYFPTLLTSSHFHQNRDVVVPELEAKLGAMYSYATGSGEFTLDAGWMVVNYFNPLRTLATFEGGFDTDFNLNGPYVGAKWIGNIA